jgi:cobalt-zinc-cadmium efflux system protein
MLADTLVSVGVVISGIVIVFTKAYWVDPIVSIIIAIVIFWSTWKLLRESTKLSLDAVPESVNIDKIKEYLDSFEGIYGYHDLHVWALSTTETALTVHLIKDNNISSNKILNEVVSYLKQNFDIRHTTIQIEKKQCNNAC